MEKIREIILLTVPRILGFIDRDSKSNTYGCCDRYFWQYKLTDFSNARFQEACLLLTLLHENNFDGNIYYKNKKVLEWILAIIDFWLKKLNKDGSAIEVYPYERSFCATSFSTFTVSESLLLLSVSDEPVRKRVTQNLEKTGLWISKNLNKEVSNQMAAAMMCLNNIYLMNNNLRYKNMADKIFDIMRLDFDKIGFFPEYGGFDIGYLSIITSLFGWYYDKTACNCDIIDIIKKVNFKLESQIDEFGNYDYSSTSRRTQFLYIYGFFKTESAVFEKVLNGIRANKIITPLWMDDRYCLAQATDYLKTYIEYTKVKSQNAKVKSAIQN
jgi:hypothetical protein